MRKESRSDRRGFLKSTMLGTAGVTEVDEAMIALVAGKVDEKLP